MVIEYFKIKTPDELLKLQKMYKIIKLPHLDINGNSINNQNFKLRRSSIVNLQSRVRKKHTANIKLSTHTTQK